MGKVFDGYGKYYDILYSDKDYEKESSFIEEAFRRYSQFKPKTILDVGCGTGGHAFPLARKGYVVSGIDASQAMIDIAKKKTKDRGNTEFFRMDVRNLHLDRKFDACICMFAVIDYLTATDEIEKALSRIRQHLKKNSLFIFDFWFGPAVLTLLPSCQIKTAEKNNVRVIRTAEPQLNILNHTCDVNYHLLVLRKNVVIDEIREKHIVRYFFPEEIKHYLEENGFKLLHLCPFPKLDAEITVKDWNAAIVSQAF